MLPLQEWVKELTQILIYATKVQENHEEPFHTVVIRKMLMKHSDTLLHIHRVTKMKKQDNFKCIEGCGSF